MDELALGAVFTTCSGGGDGVCDGCDERAVDLYFDGL